MTFTEFRKSYLWSEPQVMPSEAAHVEVLRVDFFLFVLKKVILCFAFCRTALPPRETTLAAVDHIQTSLTGDRKEVM